MAADFYSAFDREYLRDEFNPVRQQDRNPPEPDYRTIFHQDRDRILFSPTFRRLQTKTQVFQAGEYDFYRTRLTHSLEVSRIAESLAIWLLKSRPQLKIDLQLLEAISLAHDIGHPPFGHAGERVLNKLMKNYGGFEGNAQTLRILTRTIYSKSTGGRGGMSPSRALLDGVLKYKRLYRNRGRETHHFIYDDQADILKFCFGGSELRGKFGVKDANEFKSIECQVMDLADDIAYSCFDVLDGWNARFISPDRIDVWASERNANPKKKLSEAQSLHVSDLCCWMRKRSLQSRMNTFLGKELIQSTSVQEQKNFMSVKTHRYQFRLEITAKARELIQLQKDLCTDLVYGSSALQQIEFKGGEILRKLAEALFANYLAARSKKPAKLVAIGVHNELLKVKKNEKARLLCDYISGMTDAYALRSYKRLFDPDYGSISELI
jgi:dGTPase